MKRGSIAAIALAALSLSPTAAQTTMPLMTVDAVNVRDGFTLEVTGVVQGDSTPTMRSIAFTYGTDAQRAALFEACHRSLLFALSRPGQYLARIGYQTCTVALIQ